jgi:hypothetical protein
MVLVASGGGPRVVAGEQAPAPPLRTKRMSGSISHSTFSVSGELEASHVVALEDGGDVGRRLPRVGLGRALRVIALSDHHVRVGGAPFPVLEDAGAVPKLGPVQKCGVYVWGIGQELVVKDMRLWLMGVNGGTLHYGDRAMRPW